MVMRSLEKRGMEAMTVPKTCDARVSVHALLEVSIFAHDGGQFGKDRCDKPGLFSFNGTRKDGHTCVFVRCAEHTKVTADTLSSAKASVWTWEQVPC